MDNAKRSAWNINQSQIILTDSEIQGLKYYIYNGKYGLSSAWVSASYYSHQIAMYNIDTGVIKVGTSIIKSGSVITPNEFYGKCQSYCKGEFVTDTNGVLLEYKGSGDNVVVPDGVKTISSSAFFNVRDYLKSLTLPESVTEIANFAFAEYPVLEAVHLPESLKSIGVRAFAHCEKLESIYIPESAEVWQDAFIGCVKLDLDNEQIYPSFVIPYLNNGRK